MKLGLSLVLALLATMIMGDVHTAPAYAHNTAFFDGNGVLVGQKIQYCNNSRYSQGQTSSPYKRTDTYLCGHLQHISGWVCDGAECEWGEITFPGGSIAWDGGVLLPPGMTIEESCLVTNDCDTNLAEPWPYSHIDPQYL